VPYAADSSSIADLLALMPETGTNSYFEGISRVAPGTIVSIGRDGTGFRRFWKPRLATLRLKDSGEYAEAMREQLDRATARRLRLSSGEIGSQLSGGLDSASVTASAALQLDPERLLAFTAVPSVATPTPRGTFGDESPLAEAVAAKHANIEHVRVAAGRTSPLSLFDRHFQIYERPVLNPTNAVWADAINDAAQARGVRVLLTGQLGNFTISHGGYEYLPELLGSGRLIALLRLWRGMTRHDIRNRSIAVTTLGPYLPDRLWRWLLRLLDKEDPLEASSAIRGAALAEHRVFHRAAERGLDLSYRPWRDGRAMRLWGLSRVDLGVYNKGVLGGWGIDLRDPTADRDLVEFALNVPEEQYILGGMPRSLARRAFADRLPAEVAGERRRGLQAADWHLGMGEALGSISVELEALERCPVAHELIALDSLREAIADWPCEGWNQPHVHQRFALRMMRGLATGHFLRRVSRSN
jgi:asparagine synthase (glutamine-hydrolysing)